MEGASDSMYVSNKKIIQYNQLKSLIQEQNSASFRPNQSEEQKVQLYPNFCTQADIQEVESSAEEVDSEELEGSLVNEHQDEETKVERQNKKKKKSNEKSSDGKPNSYKCKVDSNVFEINLSCLSVLENFQSGFAFLCKQCNVANNKFSKFQIKNKGKSLQWWCEFCNDCNSNLQEQVKQQQPLTHQVTYLVKQMDAPKANQDFSVVLCIDVSGSMGATLDMGNDKHISRLECMQKTLRKYIQHLTEKFKNRIVGIVLFNTEVHVVGDATKAVQILQNEQLNDYDFLIQNATNQAVQRFSQTISETSTKLNERIDSMLSDTCTALGPAVLTSVAIAGQGLPGSIVVLCTDGLANEGLGDLSSEEKKQDAVSFYQKVGEMARKQSVTINLITIEGGEECNIQALSTMCEQTGGLVERLNQFVLETKFQEMLSKQIIATNVVVKVQLHQALTFRNELLQEQGQSIFRKDMGNVTADDVFTFEYDLKKIPQLVQLTDFSFEEIDCFPFQVQIEYSAPNGNRYNRIITKQQPIRYDGKINEKADSGMMMRHSMQQAAKLARNGDVRGAQVMAKSWGRQLQQKGEVVDEKSKQIYDQLSAHVKNPQSVIPDQLAANLYKAEKNTK